MADELVGVYQKLKSGYERDLAKEKKRSDLLVVLRQVVFFAAVGLGGYGVYTGLSRYILGAVPLLLVFVALVVKHYNVRKSVGYLNNLIQINGNALLRLAGQWTGFPNMGERLKDMAHPYTADLNVFGRGSLFQHINSATSYMGEMALAGLLSKLTDATEIGHRQQAVLELAGKLDWRQHFQAVGMIEAKQTHNPAQLLAWAEERPFLLERRYFKLLLWLLPITTLVLIILTMYRLAAWYLPIVFLALHLLMFAYSELVVRKAFGDTGKAIFELERYSGLIKCIEQGSFQAPLLIKLKQELSVEDLRSSHQIQALAKIADRSNFRYSPIVHVLINIAIFWDLRTLLKLEKWKSKSGRFLRTWLKVIGEFEALSSLAVLAHDNPDWAFPDVVDGPPSFEATSIGHPLISKDLRVCNDASLPSPGTVFVITGSNMSGKSTFLRTIGVNLVLAYAGAPVCARKMSCAKMSIYSGMQIQDNLESKTSTFYAELKRIKMIIDAARLGEPLVFLLDEIFKGTNSKDRIFGAKTLIRKLAAQDTIGLITTHDLELGALEREHPEMIRNYHFTDYIDDSKICFDYRLKPGISKTTNAIALMKLIGIEIEDAEKE